MYSNSLAYLVNITKHQLCARLYVGMGLERWIGQGLCHKVAIRWRLSMWTKNLPHSIWKLNMEWNRIIREPDAIGFETRMGTL